MPQPVTSLEPVDAIRVTTVVDNYIDSLLRDRPNARRFSSTVARKMTEYRIKRKS